jgi:hypothetical protein
MVVLSTKFIAGGANCYEAAIEEQLIVWWNFPLALIREDPLVAAAGMGVVFGSLTSTVA